MGLKEDWDAFEPKLREQADSLLDPREKRMFVDLSILGFVLGQIAPDASDEGDTSTPTGSTS